MGVKYTIRQHCDGNVYVNRHAALWECVRRQTCSAMGVCMLTDSAVTGVCVNRQRCDGSVYVNSHAVRQHAVGVQYVNRQRCGNAVR